MKSIKMLVVAAVLVIAAGVLVSGQSGEHMNQNGNGTGGGTGPGGGLAPDLWPEVYTTFDIDGGMTLHPTTNSSDLSTITAIGSDTFASINWGGHIIYNPGQTGPEKVTISNTSDVTMYISWNDGVSWTDHTLPANATWSKNFTDWVEVRLSDDAPSN